VSNQDKIKRTKYENILKKMLGESHTFIWNTPEFWMIYNLEVSYNSRIEDLEF